MGEQRNSSRSSGRPFKPGQSGNPGGRKPIPKAVREAKKLNAQAFEDAITLLTNMTSEELAKFVGSAKNGIKPHASCTMLHNMIAGQMLAAQKGNVAPLNFLADRTAGPVVKKIEHSGTLSTSLAGKSIEEKLALVAAEEELLKG